MRTKIAKFQVGDEIPLNAKFLYTTEEPTGIVRYGRTYKPRGGIFGGHDEFLTTIHETTTVCVYEVTLED